MDHRPWSAEEIAGSVALDELKGFVGIRRELGSLSLARDCDVSSRHLPRSRKS